MFDGILLGLQTALTLPNLGYCFIGAFLGTLIGVLPGIGPLATIAMLLPITFALPPTSALIMLAGIYYGAQYGGSTTAILVNLPGEASSVMTAVDGHEMAKRGDAGQALAIAGIGSFIAGSFATLVLAMATPFMAGVALKFGPAEYTLLMILGLVLTIVLANGSVLRAIGMTLVGILLGTIGTDIQSGAQRFTFDVPELSDGIGFIVVAMGVFGLAEVVFNLERPELREKIATKVGRLWLSGKEFVSIAPSIARGTVLGSILGVLPGGGPVIASFASYAAEKKISRTPEQFGRGAVQGVAGPESANNAAAQTSFIPMLALGIPSNAIMALMIGAMTIHNITPGPNVITANPTLYWGLIASMWVGNLMLLVLNLPLVGWWAKLLTLPYKYLFVAIILFCTIGVYSTSNSLFDVYMLCLFCVFGYLFTRFGCEIVPLLLGLVLGPAIEDNARKALIMSDGHLSTFVSSPLTVALAAMVAIALVTVTVPSIAKARQRVFG